MMRKIKKESKMAETNLAQVIEMAKDASTYDTNVKYLLADKQVLARILKYAVTEFQNMEIGDIIGSIGNDIEVGTRPLDAGVSNLGRVTGTDTEDNVPGEGKIFYDIRFQAFIREMEMKFLVNIEAQKSSDPGRLGYHLENRIIFYLARMISAQKQTEFYHSDYDSLRRVRSIWICMDNRENEDSIEEIVLDRRVVFGNKIKVRDVDLMKGIIINIRKNADVNASQNILISMLEKLLSKMDVDRKKHILMEEYGMIMSEELERRLQTMCNLSEIIIEEGLREGMERGIEQGRKKERLDTIRRMLKAGMYKEQIISLGYSEEEFAESENAEAENTLCAR